MKDKFSLVVPTYNEGKNIESLCTRLLTILNENCGQFEIIIVDDNSPDGTWQIAQSLAERNKSIKVIRRLQERDLSTAVVAGWQLANGDVLGVIDADFQHPPEVISDIIKKISLDREADIVIASRNVRGGGVSEWSILRRSVSWIGNLISRLFLPRILAKVRDPMSGFFILHREVIKDKLLTPNGYKILLEVLAKGSYRKVIEVPYIFQERKRGGSKISLKQYLRFLRHISKLSFQTGEIFWLIRNIIVCLTSILLAIIAFLSLSKIMYAGLFYNILIGIITGLAWYLLITLCGRIVFNLYPKECIENLLGKGYYHKALDTNKTQKYWHYKKFEIISKKLCYLPILDIGSGPGFFLYLYGKDTGLKVNLDNSYEQLRYAKNLNRQAHYVVGIADNLPFISDSFGTVCFIETVEHLTDTEIKHCLFEILRVLKKGGKLIISTPNYKSIWPLLEIIISIFGPINYRIQHITHFDLKKLIQYIEAAGFKIKNKESFFILSPFLSLFAKSLSDFFFDLERKIFPKYGSILLVESIKE